MCVWGQLLDLPCEGMGDGIRGAGLYMLLRDGALLHLEPIPRLLLDVLLHNGAVPSAKMSAFGLTSPPSSTSCVCLPAGKARMFSRLATRTTGLGLRAQRQLVRYVLLLFPPHS